MAKAKEKTIIGEPDSALLPDLSWGDPMKRFYGQDPGIRPESTVNYTDSQSSTTESPTKSPTKSPTESPINSPSLRDTFSRTDRTTDSLTASPTESTSPSHIVSTTDSTTARPIDSPTTSPPDSPIYRQSYGPTVSPTASTTTEETFVYLDATHTGSEQKLYSIMYRQTNGPGLRNPERFKVPDLQIKSGIRSHVTVRRALDGLVAKLSIERIYNKDQFRYGAIYHVYTPKEINKRRAKAGIKIDPITKQITSPTDSPIVSPITSPTLGITTNRSERLTESQLISHSISVGQEIQEVDGSNPANLIYQNSINPAGSNLSSSVPRNDDEKLIKVRKLFEQLSNGGTWKDERDVKSYQEITHINLFHVTLGLCYSIAKSPEHKMSSLAYAIPSILKHAEDMGEFPDTVLGEIAYKSKRTTMNCIATGKWTVPDWETGKE